MQKPEFVLEIFLQPGEYFFCNHETRLRTILGSCVSITFWHPQKRIGGMTHFMLPQRAVHKASLKPDVLDGKYADESLALIMSEIERHGTKPDDYQVKIFGGGDMFNKVSGSKTNLNIGDKNIAMAQSLLKELGFKIHAKHLGDIGHRSIIFDIWSGYVWVKHQKFTTT